MDKVISEQQILGERGVALVSTRVHEMGFIWRPTTVSDAGIDGHIELRNPSTGAASNQLIQVQVKSTAKPTNERPESFDFRVEKRDLEYWLRGNLPVILVVAIPDRGEVYWLPVRAFAYDESGRLKLVQRFDTTRNRLDISSRDQLALLVQSVRPGYYEPPRGINEVLISNLLPVARMLPRLYVAPTTYRARPAVFKVLQESGQRYGAEWLIKDKTIISAHDLTLPPYDLVCDPGAVDDFAVEEWSESGDESRRRDFVQLLNACLREKTKGILRFQHERPIDCLYFLPAQTGISRVFGYRAAKNRTTREVVTVKKRKDGSIGFVRHNAIKWRFFDWNQKWFLEITPTYLFTSDGHRPLRYYEELLKGIKRLENNGAVLGQLQMWAALLCGDGDMVDEPYPLLGFDKPVTFDVSFGVIEKDWALRFGHPEPDASNNEATDEQRSFELL